MNFDLKKSIEILEKTPGVIRNLLTGLNADWIINNEGPDTFSPYDVVGHLIHGEKTDWPDRIAMILEHGTSKAFIPYDRFAMFEESKGKTLNQLLIEFEKLRKEKLLWLKSLTLAESDLDKKGMHPTFGE